MVIGLELGAQTIGLIEQQIGHLDGYVLFSPLESKSTFLIDKCGRLVHSWQSKYKPGQSYYLLPHGYLLRAGNDSNTAFVSGGGRIELYDWNNKLKWSYVISNSLSCLHHDIYPMPNGNILAILWEKKTKAEAIAVGRNPDLVGNYVWNEKIIELKPKGKNDAEIVWQWDVWEHLVQDFDSKLPNYGVINEQPGLININYNANKNEDWLHFNAVTYNVLLDEVMISNRNFSEIYIVKHQSKKNSEKQISKNPIIYRWGNSAAYNANNFKSKHLYSQHSPVWISTGLKNENKIILFNNGLGRRAEQYSTVEIISPKRNEKNEYVIDDDLKPEWIYADTSGSVFFSHNVSNAQVLPKGHIMICEGAKGRFFELDERNNIVWEYVNPVIGTGPLKQNTTSELNRVFRCMFYLKTDKALKHKSLKPLKLLELEPLEKICIPGQ